MFASLAGWLRQQRVPFSENEPIAPHLYFRIGGPVRLLVSPRTMEEAASVLQRLAGGGDGPPSGSPGRPPFLVVGGGSNIAFGDGPTRAAVVRIPAPLRAGARQLDPRTIEVDAGMRTPAFLAWCATHGAGGLEFLSGIPGTLGGAAAVNAGAFGRAMSDVLLEADFIDAEGRRRVAGAAHFAFRYRDSSFKLGRETLLSLRLAFESAGEEAIARRTRENLEYRARRHPSYRLASAGCFFKNPLRGGVKESAGRIIEECGLKRAACGDLTVSAEHANFILNRGRGSFADLQRLEERIRAEVAARTGIVLEREVIYVSPDGEKY